MEFFRALASTLDRVEEASRHTAGALPLIDGASGEPLGRIMAEGARVCWVTARHSPTSLGERIASATGQPHAELRALYQQCREEGRPLGETLVSRGLLEGDRLRALLAAQNATSLASLVRASLNGARWGDWSPVPSRSYQPAFTFASSEMVHSIVTLDLEAEILAPPMPEPFIQEVRRRAFALCLLLPDGHGEHCLPVATSAGLELTLEDSRRMARQASRLIRPPSFLAAGVKPVFTLVHQGVEVNEDVPVTSRSRRNTPGVAVARTRHHMLVAHYRRAIDGVPLMAALRRFGRQGGEE